MINFINYQKITNWKNVRKKLPIGKIQEELVILKMLDQGLYAQEIVQKISVSAKKISRIITSFKERGFLTQIRAYPKVYQLTNLGKLILTQGDPKQRRIQEYTKEEKAKPKWLDKLRVHKLRFKNKLIQKPSWLSGVREQEQRNGLTIKRIELNNWTKFLLTFNYQDFNGLEKIEVCNKVIIYNFNQNIDEQYVSSKEDLDTYLATRIEDCKKAREFIQQKGFTIDNTEPVFCQKPHYAIETHGDPKALGSIGPLLNITIKTPNEIREFDDSLGKGEGEEETDDKEKAKSMFDVPQQIENLDEKISNLEKAMIGMVDGIKEMTKIFSSLVKQPEQTISIKTDPEGMFR